jgi:hypothetical protein
MLKITVPSVEYWDESKNEFVYTKEQTLTLEHSLVSLSKWESKWCKPFLTKDDKTTEETIDYIRCMTLTQNVDPDVYNRITDEIIDQVNAYIKAPMTATYVSEDKGGPVNREQVTSELIYYWMITLTIPCEYQKWHLNRLLTLIRVCNRKNQPPKKTNGRDVARRYAAANKARRKQLNTRG